MGQEMGGAWTIEQEGVLLSPPCVSQSVPTVGQGGLDCNVSHWSLLDWPLWVQRTACPGSVAQVLLCAKQTQSGEGRCVFWAVLGHFGQVWHAFDFASDPASCSQ